MGIESVSGRRPVWGRWFSYASIMRDRRHTMGVSQLWKCDHKHDALTNVAYSNKVKHLCGYIGYIRVHSSSVVSIHMPLAVTMTEKVFKQAILMMYKWPMITPTLDVYHTVFHRGCQVQVCAPTDSPYGCVVSEIHAGTRDPHKILSKLGFYHWGHGGKGKTIQTTTKSWLT